LTALARVFPTTPAPTCCHDDCHQADVRNDLCSTHGVDCADCGERFDLGELRDGKCADCAPIDPEMVDYSDICNEPMAARGER
jgi:hypothetical protein